MLSSLSCVAFSSATLALSHAPCIALSLIVSCIATLALLHASISLSCIALSQQLHLSAVTDGTSQAGPLLYCSFAARISQGREHAVSGPRALKSKLACVCEFCAFIYYLTQAVHLYYPQRSAIPHCTTLTSSTAPMGVVYRNHDSIDTRIGEWQVLGGRLD